MAGLSESHTTDSPMSDSNNTQDCSRRVQTSIHRMLQTALNETLIHGQPAITLKQRSKGTQLFVNPTNGALEASTSDTVSYRTYNFPGKDAHEAWKFTITVRILAIIVEALHSQLVVSKRDVYYCDPAGFGSQRVVDNVIEDVALTIGVNRLALNVEAAAKGLTVGCYGLKTKSRGMMDIQLSTENQDTLIPRLEDIEEIDISGADWVLVLEKEAVFHRLARSKWYTRAVAGKGILITGKGYPDLGTRAFVRRLLDIRASEASPLPFYVLVDGDPDGIAIMSTYKYGSKAHAHENAKLNARNLHWLGLRMSDIVASLDPDGDNDGLLRMSARDRKKAVALLKNNPVWAVYGPEPEWRAELQRMMMLNLKAEIEILYDQNDGLEGWLDREMSTLSC